MRVAVVGNSADVVRSRKGEVIDACDLVIRLNSFRTRGVEALVGSRTDVVSICLAPWVVENALATAAATLASVPVVWTPSWRGHAEDHEVETAMRTIGHDPASLVFSDDTGHGDAMRGMYEAFRLRALARPGVKTRADNGMSLLPTTGFLTVHLVRLRFPSADVFITGFGLESDFALDRFDESGVKMWPGHDIPTEREWFLEGAASGQWRLL